MKILDLKWRRTFFFIWLWYTAREKREIGGEGRGKNEQAERSD